MNTRNIGIAIAIIAVVLLGAGAVWVLNRLPASPAPSEGQATSTVPVATTTGTTPTPTQPSSTDTAALNQRIYDNGVYITPLEVVEDSRCPMGVYCIQAGTVRLRAKLEGDGGVETVVLTVGSPVSFGSKHVTLMSVSPVKKQQGITLSEYRFTFSVTYGMGEATGTLSGVMTLGPVCPVEQVNNPCKPTAEMYAARKIAVYAQNRTTLITTITPGADGTFSLTLPVGSYYLAMASPSGGVGSVTGLPATITITGGTTAHISVDVDTGIR